jgi:hypothetical protein
VPNSVISSHRIDFVVKRVLIFKPELDVVTGYIHRNFRETLLSQTIAIVRHNAPSPIPSNRFEMSLDFHPANTQC